jgi:ribosomal protein S16
MTNILVIRDVNGNGCAHIRSRLRRDGRTLAGVTYWLPTHQRSDELAVNRNEDTLYVGGKRQKITEKLQKQRN